MFKDLGNQLLSLVNTNIQEESKDWLLQKLEKIKSEKSTRELYITYSLCASKIPKSELVEISALTEELKDYLRRHSATKLEISRLFLLHSVLSCDADFVLPVQNLIQVADKEELETFLKYLSLLPNPDNFKFAAVEALRTNIATVFDAISKENPYPARYFNDQQWNQMYLKAAFMQRDLSTINNVEERANKELARIISDYAHERWAASRDIDPMFWRPVSNFVEGQLEKDVLRLFESDNLVENRAAALVCHHSEISAAKEILSRYPDLKHQVEQGKFNWETLKN